MRRDYGMKYRGARLRRIDILILLVWICAGPYAPRNIMRRNPRRIAPNVKEHRKKKNVPKMTAKGQGVLAAGPMFLMKK